MKKQKFSMKNLLFKSAAEFVMWYKHITKQFKDLVIVSCKKMQNLFMYKVKYSI